MTSRSIDGIIYDMATELAPLDSSVADAVKEAVLSRIASLVPCKVYTWVSQSLKGRKYKDVFFPDYSKKDYEDEVENIGLDDFGVALICKSIPKYAESSMSDYMYDDQIKSKIESMNTKLKPTLPVLYSKVIKTYWPEFKRHYDQVKNQLSTARTKYKALLIASAHDHAIWYATDQWDSPHTECFHHWVKYMALGASDSQVDDLILDVKAAGFPVPGEVDVAKWRQHSYLYYKAISNADIDDDVRPNITETVRDGYPNQFRITCYFSKRFTEPGQRTGSKNRV